MASMRWEFIAELCNAYNLRTGAELGVKEGRFSLYLLEHVPNSVLYSVDLWSPQTGRQGEGVETYADWPHEAYYRAFVNACAPYADRSHILKMSTAEAVSCVPDNLDFVFIDADHSTQGVYDDLKWWVPKIRDGGLISGHDFNWPSVQKALRKFFGQDVKIYEGPNNVWFTWK